MKGTLYFIRLLRPVNLIIIALTMFLMRYFVIKPPVAVNGFELQLSLFHFVLLVISTVLIAAAGNVINDYFDQRSDRVNKPRNVIVGVHVKRRVAMAAHQVFNLIGLALAIYVAWRIGMWKLSIVTFFAAASLWFYSVQFKRELIIGNLIVAILVALVPLLVGIYEIPLLIREYGPEVAEYFSLRKPGEDPSMYFKIMFYFVLGYSIFGFLLNLIREIQKDIADLKGDRELQAKTIPLVYGVKTAKIIVTVLSILVIVLLLIAQDKVIDDPYSLWYLIGTIVLPLLVATWLNFKARIRKDYMRASSFVKVSMLFGVLYSIVHYYIYYAGELS